LICDEIRKEGEMTFLRKKSSPPPCNLPLFQKPSIEGDRAKFICGFAERF
jgi:hypothetical protein